MVVVLLVFTLGLCLRNMGTLDFKVVKNPPLHTCYTYSSPPSLTHMLRTPMTLYTQIIPCEIRMIAL